MIHIHRPGIGLRAVLVVDNTACGTAIGGIRMAPDADAREAFRLARELGEYAPCGSNGWLTHHWRKRGPYG